MSADIKFLYKPADRRYIFLTGNSQILKELEKHLNKIPQYQLMRGFHGIPRPEVFLNKFKSKSGEIIYYCHAGLWKTCCDWFDERHVSYEGIDNDFKYTGFDMSLEDFTDYIRSWELNIVPREYQIKAAWMILHYRQSLSQLATRAGKTLIAYMIFRYLLEHGAKKILMVVPSIQLVKQGVEDFKEYKEFFQSEQIWAKSEYCTSANLTIGTYQSLVQRLNKHSKRYDPSFFNGYDVVLIDEAHHLICKSINMILGHDFMRDVVLRFGFTGTLPEENTIESFCCHSLMGPTIQDLTSAELIGGGFLAEPLITQYRITYPDSCEQLKDQYVRCGEYLCGNDKLVDGKKVLLPSSQREFTIRYEKNLPVALKQLKELYDKDEYISYLVDLCKAKGANLLMLEQMLVHRAEARIDLMCNIIAKHEGTNGIVFAHHTEYLNYLEKVFKERFKDKIIYKIDGSTNLKKRQAILDEMLKNNNVILVASYQCCGTGLTFKNVDYCVFAQSFKSNIINLQSIGRLLLKTDTKTQAYIYDIVDIFPTKKLYQQGLAKVKMYKKSKFKYEIVKV